MTTASGRKMHIISYYYKYDLRERSLLRIADDPRFSDRHHPGAWPVRVNHDEFPDPEIVFKEQQLRNHQKCEPAIRGQSARHQLTTLG